MSSRAELARDFFIELGWSQAQAAGIVGNLQQESGPGLDTGAEGDEGTAFGIAQWRGKRQTRLDTFAKGRKKDRSDLETQLRFVDYELRNFEKQAFEQLQAAQTVPDAAAAMLNYERPKGWTKNNDPRDDHGWTSRLSNAMALVGGKPSGTATQDIAAMASATPDAGPTLNQVLGGVKGGTETEDAPKPKPTLADFDFKGLFDVPEPLPPPPLPPIPDPVPIEAYAAPQFQSRTPWSSKPQRPLGYARRA